MSKFCAALALVCAFSFTGCQSSHQGDIQTALDAIGAAREAAAAELPDTPLSQGAIGILDVALATYNQVHADDQGHQSLPYYLQWLTLAAKAVAAVISIIEGAGIDVPEIILQARDTLQSWIR